MKVRLDTLNIRAGRVGGLELALRALCQGKVDMGIVQETKLTDRIHARQGEGYSIWEIEAEIIHWGGIADFWGEDTGWQVEGIINYGRNVASLFLMSGTRR